MTITERTYGSLHSSPLPVGAPLGQGQQTFAMFGGPGMTDLSRYWDDSHPTPRDHKHLTMEFMSPIRLFPPNPQLGLCTGRRTDHSRKPTKDPVFKFTLSCCQILPEVSNISLLTVFPLSTLSHSCLPLLPRPQLNPVLE